MASRCGETPLAVSSEMVDLMRLLVFGKMEAGVKPDILADEVYSMGLTRDDVFDLLDNGEWKIQTAAKSAFTRAYNAKYGEVVSTREKSKEIDESEDEDE